MKRPLFVLAALALLLAAYPVAAQDASVGEVTRTFPVEGGALMRVTYTPDPGTEMPEIRQFTDATGLECVLIGGGSESTTLCPSGGPSTRNDHLLPSGMCFSHDVFIRKGLPWIFICVCVPDLHGNPPEGPSVHVLENNEGNPFACVGVVAFNGFAWVCLLEPALV